MWQPHEVNSRILGVGGVGLIAIGKKLESRKKELRNHIAESGENSRTVHGQGKMAELRWGGEDGEQRWNPLSRVHLHPSLLPACPPPSKKGGWDSALCETSSLSMLVCLLPKQIVYFTTYSPKIVFYHLFKNIGFGEDGVSFYVTPGRIFVISLTFKYSFWAWLPT